MDAQTKSEKSARAFSALQMLEASPQILEHWQALSNSVRLDLLHPWLNTGQVYLIAPTDRRFRFNNNKPTLKEIGSYDRREHITEQVAAMEPVTSWNPVISRKCLHHSSR